MVETHTSHRRTDSRAKNGISSNALNYMAGQAAMAVFGLVSGIVLARYLPKKVFGQYSYLLALTILFLPLLDGGAHAFYAALAARDRSRIGAYWARAVALKIYTFPFVTLLLAAYFFLFTHALGGLFSVVLFYVAMQSLLLSTDIVFRAAEQGRAWAIRRTLYDATSLLLILAVVVLLDVKTAAFVLLLSSIAVGVAAIWAIGAAARMTGLTLGQFLDAVREPLRMDEIRPLLPFAANTLLWVLFYRETNILLEYLGTRIDLGDYRVAFVVMTAALYLPRSVTWASVPRIALHHAQLDEGNFQQVLSKAIRVNFYLATLITVGGTLYGERLIGIVFGPQYAHLGLAWQAFNLLLGVMFIQQFCMDLLNALRQERRLAGSMALGIVVLTSLDLLLIPRYGTAGAATAQLIAGLAMLPTSFVTLARWIRPAAALAPTLRLAAAASISGLIGFALIKVNFFLSFLAFVPVFVAVSQMTGAMPEQLAGLVRRVMLFERTGHAGKAEPGLTLGTEDDASRDASVAP